MRRGEYGGVPWYLLFTLVAAGGAGVGTYVVLHEREVEKRRLAAIEAAKPKPPAPAPAPKPVETAQPTAGIMIDTPRVDGELTATDVEIRVGGLREKLDICYAGTDGEGTVELELVIHATGRTMKVTPTTSFDDSVANCVTAVLETLRFPSRTSNTRVTQTIRFSR